jgi:DNA-binding MarR family transcriptional regulator
MNLQLSGYAARVTPQTRWLDESEMAAWRALVQAVSRLPTTLDAQLRRDADLSFLEYYVLAALSESPDGTVGMGTLTVLTNAEQSRLSHLLKRMESKGLATRERDPGNGRATLVRITEAGQARISSAAPAHVEHVRRVVFDGMTPGDVHALERICLQINAQIGP